MALNILIRYGEYIFILVHEGIDSAVFSRVEMGSNLVGEFVFRAFSIFELGDLLLGGLDCVDSSASKSSFSTGRGSGNGVCRFNHLSHPDRFDDDLRNSVIGMDMDWFVSVEVDEDDLDFIFIS